jgi:hypothetical protein
MLIFLAKLCVAGGLVACAYARSGLHGVRLRSYSAAIA